MANIKSQIKRNRQNDKRRLRNRVYRGTARITVRSARTAIEDGAPESKAALTSAISALDKAVAQGVLHKNNAARRKSRLMKVFGKMVPAAVAAEPAMVEPVAEAEPKKAASRRRGAKAEPKAEVASEPKAETKKTTAKKATTKKEPVKKPASTAKKPAAKKKA